MQVTGHLVLLVGEEVQEGADRHRGLGRVPQVRISDDGVVVPPADLLLVDVAGVLQITQDQLSGSFGDPDLLGQVPDPAPWIPTDRHQQVAVIGQERPGPFDRLGHHRMVDRREGSLDQVGAATPWRISSPESPNSCHR